MYPPLLFVMALSLVKLKINVVAVVPCIKTKGSQLTAKIWIPLSICTPSCFVYLSMGPQK